MKFFGLGLVFLLLSGGVASAELPVELQEVKQQIIDITRANTTNTGNEREVRAELEPLIEELEAWFNANRPENELALLQVPWKNLWFDDPDITFDINLIIFRLQQPRDRIFQVVEEGYYYNVAELKLQIFWIPFTITSFLKGAYEIIRPATEENSGDPQLNTVALEFVSNGLRLGSLNPAIPLSLLVQAVDVGLVPTIPTFGPIGVTGELWNLYIDEDLRISAGFNNNEPDTIDLYILERVTTPD